MNSSTKKKQGRQSKLSLYLILAMLVVLIGSIFFTSAWVMSVVNKNSQSAVDIQIVPYDFVVATDFGFDLDTDALHFGEGIPGTTLAKKINLTSSSDVDVEILWDGAGMISASDIDFFLPANRTQTVKFYLTIPDNLSLGNYSGFIYLYFYKPY